MTTTVQKMCKYRYGEAILVINLVIAYEHMVLSKSNFGLIRPLHVSYIKGRDYSSEEKVYW